MELKEEQAVETKPELTQEEQQGHMKQMLEFHGKAYSELIGVHVQRLTQIMMSNNGVSELQKRQANTALLEALKFALDYGLGLTKPKIRDRGTVLAHETNELASILVKAYENKMMLQAIKLQEQQDAEAIQEDTITEQEIN